MEPVLELSKAQQPAAGPFGPAPAPGNGLKPAPERGTVLFEDQTVRVVRLNDGTECGDAPWVAVERRSGPRSRPRRGRTGGATPWGETVPVVSAGQDGLNAVVYALGRAVADLVETRSPEPEARP